MITPQSGSLALGEMARWSSTARDPSHPTRLSSTRPTVQHQKVLSPKITVGFSQSSYTLMSYRVVARARRRRWRQVLLRGFSGVEQLDSPPRAQRHSQLCLCGVIWQAGDACAYTGATSAYSLRANQPSWPGELLQSPSHPIPASRNDVLTTTIDASRVIRVVWGSSSACAPHFLPCHSLFHTNLKSPCAEQRRRPLPARAVRLRADHLRLPSLPCDDTGALVPQE